MLHYQDTGQGPLIVLLHGLTENSTAWDPLVGPLATAHRVLALDLRGHGRSLVQPPYDMVSLAEDVHATLDVVAPEEPPLMVGHSLGGMVATVYAAMHPVRAVLNVEQSLDFASMLQTVQDMLPRLRTGEYTGALDTLFTQLEGGALTTTESARLRRLRHYDRDVVLGIWGVDQLQAGADELNDMTAGLLGGIRAPYLALHGSDPGPRYRAWITAAGPSAALEVWPGCGHYPHLVLPERFVTRVRQLALAAGHSSTTDPPDHLAG
ncbi:alpha/beta fold hydrolase [Streptomyces sp. NPDC090493]|uniref:alpha/beta fold hydrolase n=1 Tax=Streptomyces sp. NPDC090493 TaxID=3365964 RepID=UPI00380F91BF